MCERAQHSNLYYTNVVIFGEIIKFLSNNLKCEIKRRGAGRLGVRKKERFVLGKRTFRSKKSKHFVLRIISARYIDLAGSDYSKESKWYDPEKVQDSEIDVYITEGSNTPVYQMVMNEFLMELYKNQAINVKQLLENSSLPFAERILESIKRDEAEMLQAQEEGRMAQLQGIPSEVIGQIRA